MSTIRATVWNENVHERTEPHIMPFYPHGIHGAVAAALTDQLGDSVEVTTATLDQPDAGLPEELLARTDVLFWWGHLAHDDVPDSVVDRVQRHVLGGMGLSYCTPGTSPASSLGSWARVAHWHGATTAIARSSGRLRRAIHLPRASLIRWCLNTTRRIASSSTCRNPTKRSSSVRSPAARCSARGSPTGEGVVESSTSVRETRNIPSISNRARAECSPTPQGGQPAMLHISRRWFPIRRRNPSSLQPRSDSGKHSRQRPL